MNAKIGIVGAGDFAREVLCLLYDLGRIDDVLGFYEDDTVWKAGEIKGIPVFPRSAFDPALCKAVPAIAHPASRAKVVGELPSNTTFENLIHPSVVISPWVQLGEGIIICAGCILTCDIVIKNQVHLNLMTTVGHDSILDDFVTTAPGVQISGKCRIGKRVYLGTNSALKQQIRISDDITVGMGAVVVKDLLEAGTYVGNPARKIAGE